VWAARGGDAQRDLAALAQLSRVLPRLERDGQTAVVRTQRPGVRCRGKTQTTSIRRNGYTGAPGHGDINTAHVAPVRHLTSRYRRMTRNRGRRGIAGRCADARGATRQPRHQALSARRVLRCSAQSSAIRTRGVPFPTVKRRRPVTPASAGGRGRPRTTRSTDRDRPQAAPPAAARARSPPARGSRG